MYFSKRFAASIAVVALVVISMPQKSFACACGCGVFDVGTNMMFANGTGGMASLEYDFMDQTKDMNGNNVSPSDNNTDKRIRSEFYTAGLDYMFNRDWGVDVKVPYTNRGLDTDIGGGDVEGYNHGGLGDIRVQGVYTGISADMSTGLEFGVKLPTGSYTMDGFDRDTEIGTGSTNALFGAYQLGRFSKNNPYSWFVHGMVNQAVLTQEGYRPGTEFDAATGVAHDPVPVGEGVKIAPVLQLLGSYRNSDTGANADPADSGYKRALVSPGIEFSYGPTKLYTDVSLPVYQNVNGYQLVAPVLFQAVVSYDF